MNMNKYPALAGAIVLPLFILIGCNEKKAEPALKAAALVNGQAIAAAQIDAELEKLGQVPPDQAQAIANKVLGNVLDQELLAQEAVKSKLADSEAVRMKIEATRRQILAEAHLGVLTKDMAAPADTEIKAYFDAHPELFANRRIYQLQEMIIPTTPENLEKIQGMVSQARTPRALAQALKAAGIEVSARQSVKAAEELPSELLEKLKDLPAGQSVSLGKANSISLLIVANTEARPVDYDQAKDAISRYLVNEKKRDGVRTALVKLRSAAKIEYQPPFANVTAPTEKTSTP